MNYLNKTYYVLNKKPQLFDAADFNDKFVVLTKSGATLDYGTIHTDERIYACLSNDQLRFINIITAGSDSDVLFLIFWNDQEYADTLKQLKSKYPDIRFSNQDIKLNSYARAISAKQRDGININIVDAIVEDNYIECPSCGALNDKASGLPYCLDCGEDLY